MRQREREGDREGKKGGKREEWGRERGCFHLCVSDLELQCSGYSLSSLAPVVNGSETDLQSGLFNLNPNVLVFFRFYSCLNDTFFLFRES